MAISPLTVDSPVLTALRLRVESLKTGFSFKEYVDAINKSPLLIQALNQFSNSKGEPFSISVDENPAAISNLYRPGERSLVVIENQLISPHRLARVLAHEIYGHDLT